MERTRVGDVMSSPAITVPADTRVPAAMALMKQHSVRHLPVVDNGRVIGIVSRGDLREASTTIAATNANSYEINFMLSRLECRQIMTRKVFTVTAEALVVDAAELMVANKIAGLPVVDRSGVVVGMVTDSDLLSLLVRKIREAENQGQPTSI